MQEQPNSSDTHKYGLQEYLSLGYIYLILLGIVGDVIYYKFFDINILDYVTLSDVLMAPINTLVSDLRILAIVVLAIVVVYLLYFKGLPWLHFKAKEKGWYQKVVKDVDKLDAKIHELKNSNVVWAIAYFLFCMFVGVNMGSGGKIKKRIDQGDFKASHQLTFSDNTIKQVKVIGQNTVYLFYVLEKQKDIHILLISGNIKEIRVLPKEVK